MNLDVLAAMFTLLLIATMIGLASKGEPVAEQCTSFTAVEYTCSGKL